MQFPVLQFWKKNCSPRTPLLLTINLRKQSVSSIHNRRCLLFSGSTEKVDIILLYCLKEIVLYTHVIDELTFCISQEQMGSLYDQSNSQQIVYDLTFYQNNNQNLSASPALLREPVFHLLTPACLIHLHTAFTSNINSNVTRRALEEWPQTLQTESIVISNDMAMSSSTLMKGISARHSSFPTYVSLHIRKHRLTFE